MPRETPFRILVLADFSGSCRVGSASRPKLVDRDNFDEVLAEIGPTGYQSLDDFHPDRLFQADRAFDRLRDLRERVADPESFRQIAAEWKSQAAAEDEPPARASAPPVPSGNLLDLALDEGEAAGPAPARRRDEFAEYLAKIVAPHLVAREDPRQADFVARVDAAIAETMRRVLHDEAFQAMEAAWRALDFLVHRVETGPDLKIYAVDVAQKDITGSSGALQDLILGPSKTPGAPPWSLLVANYRFSTGGRDIGKLNWFGRLAQAAGAPFLAEVELSSSESPHWETLRGAPYAPWIGLALPRFLLRLPYGKKTSPIESFQFEEMSGPPDHSSYLWGNPAMACACLLARTFNRDGWDMRAGTLRELSGLPLHVYDADGEPQVKPCGELLMTHDEAEMLLEMGIMPLVTMKDQDVVRLVRFQSVAKPLEPLAGPWN